MAGDSQTGEIIVDGEYATLSLERRFKHPPEVVWDAITDTRQLAKWYMTNAKIDRRVGGNIDYLSGPSLFHVTGRILEWDPPHVFEHEWNVEPRPELPKGEKSVLRWEILRDGEGSVLKMTHRDLTRRTALGFAPGAHAFLDRLEATLDGTALPHWLKRVSELRSSYPTWRPAQ